MAFISTRIRQFSYFDHQLENPAWKNRKILDYGGNVGGFLVGSGDHVNHDNYWCIDVSRLAIEQGSRQFPKAHFVHYDRYSSEFNPTGVRYLPIPDCGVKFDFILAFSVFTHTHQREMLALVKQLRRMLSPQGAIAFTFCDPSHDGLLSNTSLPPDTEVQKQLELQKAKAPSLDVEDVFERARQSNWYLRIGDQLYIEPLTDLCHQKRQGKPGESYGAVYSVAYMGSLFPDGEIRPPVCREWQHCCILRNS